MARKPRSKTGLSPNVDAFYWSMMSIYSEDELEGDVRKAVAGNPDPNKAVARVFAFWDNDLTKYEQAEFLKWFAKKLGIPNNVKWGLIEECD